MKKLVFGLLSLLLIPATGFSQGNKQFYAGATGGMVVPMVLHEIWNNVQNTQTATLVEELNNGFMAGVKIGYVPKAVKKILAIELEYNYQKTIYNRLTTGGFIAGDSVIPGFTQELKHSSIHFNSLFLNIIARYPLGKVHPYLGFAPGVTCTFISFDEPGLFTESSSNINFSWQALAGVDFDITSYLTLGGGYKYFSVNNTMKWANGSHSHYDPRSNNFFLDIKFLF
jgi:opacity protein-like surface antigen